ncbi:MAG TPA: SGNH/GDSL hydrolase family protein [Planctomycetota bacterium]|nr:SGNH/GDSL hydrolase family protein [Planctomycetota bacterium]
MGGAVAAPRRRRRSWPRRLGFLIGLLLLLALGLELGARALFPSPFSAEGDLVGMYENAEEQGSVRTVPGWEGEFTVEGRTVPVRLDRLGLRSPEIGPRQPDELRVLCLGDSFVFGYGVAGEEAFPALLQGLLAQQLGRPVVTGNAGVPGYGTVEQARCLRRVAAAFDPDVVVSTIYLGNDFVDDQQRAKYVEGGYCMGGDWAALLRRSARARFMLRSRAWMKLELALIEAGSPWALQPVPPPDEEAAFAGFPPRNRPNQCVAGLFMDVIDPQRSWDAAQPLPVVPRVLDKVRESLSAMRATAGRAPVLVVLMPSWWHVSEPDRMALLKKVRLDPAEYRLGLTQQRLEELCASMSLPVVDLTPRFTEHGDPDHWFLQADRHLNAEGHRFVAETVAPAIEALLR